MNIELDQVPPPKELRPSEIADSLGLVRGLRAEKNQFDMCRCHECRKWINNGDWLVWVPSSIAVGDSEAEISEQARLKAYNGDWTGWCLKCAPKKSVPIQKPLSLFKRIFG